MVDTRVNQPTFRTRLAAAIAIGLIGACTATIQFQIRDCQACDFTVAWRAARHLLAGENPYTQINPTGPYPWDGEFFYPIFAAISAIPFSFLAPGLAGAVFFGTSSALLAYALLEDGWSKLPLFLSAPYWVAAATGQWSPLISAATLLPGIQALALVKPNLGAAALLYKPSLKVLAGCTIFFLFSLVIMPNWPLEWMQEIGNKQAAAQYHYPFLTAFPYGSLLLASAFMIRKPEGRLLLALSVVRQKLWFYDQLQLWLIPKTLRQSMLLTLLSWLAYGIWYFRSAAIPLESPLKQPDSYLIFFCYLPALALVLKNHAGEWRAGAAAFTRRFAHKA